MCNICGHYTCPGGCPNADEPVVVLHCEKCNCGIREGDSYYDVEGVAYCEDCMHDMLKEVEWL